jgi:Rab-GTPase-TBC domain
MNFIVGMLLCYMDQEAAFWMLIAILTHHKMIGLFQKECPLLPHFLNAFEHELRVHLPRLAGSSSWSPNGALFFLSSGPAVGLIWL